uniref:YadA family autotransporter adhesin n=1 Tax=uncultured Aggregatibacter sp. TaxID=470564 RepID=UPI0025969CD6
TVTLGKAGTDGKDGKIGVNGKDGSAVVINGKDGSIGLNGANGANGLTIKSANGKDGVDGANGANGKTRIVYETPNGGKEEVATLKDGLVFTGNNSTVLNKHKLNSTVNVVGDSTAAELNGFVSATGNLNVVADGTDKLTVQMSKNLKNLNSVTMVNETDPDKSVKLNVTDKGELNVGGDKADGNQVTGVKSSISDKLGAGDKFADKLNKAATDNPTNAVNVSDLKQTRDSITTSDLGGGFGLKDQDDAEVKQDLGTTVKVKGDANVYTKVVTDGTGKALEVGLKDTVTLGKAGTDGKDGKIGVNGKDGSAVVINGKDGSIGLNGKDGKDGLTMKSAQGKPGVDGKDGETKTRIVYELKDKDGNPVKDADGKVVKEEVATLNDGLKFGANAGTVHNAKLNTQVDVKGAVTNTDWNKFDAGKNIMTNIDGNTITVGLAKDLDVNSVTTGDTKVENSGITIKNGSEQSKTVSLTKTGLNNGGNQVVNMDSGLKDSQGNKVTLTEATGDVLNNGVNVGDLKETVNKLIGPSDIGGFGLKDKAGNEFKQSLGTTAQITGDKNINTKVVDVLDAQGQATGKKALEVGLNPEVELGKKGNDGVDGKLTVNGKDGSSVVVDGSNGSIGLNGKDGKDGLTMKSEVGEAGLDQNNATDPNKPDDKGSKTRLVYEHVLKDKDGNPQKGQDGKPVTVKEQVATLNDGLVFAGNNTDKENKHKLNSKVNIVGDSTAEQLKDFKSATGNLNVVADGNNKLTVQMSKNLKNLNSVTLENPTDAKKSVTLTVTDKGELNVGGDKAEGNQVTGVKSSITDKAGATFADKLKNAADKDNGNPNNAVNVGDLYNVFSGESGGGFGLKDKAGNEFKQDLGTTAQITGDKNINTKVVDVLDAQGQATGKKALEVGLNPEIELGEKAVPGVNGQPGKDGVDGKIGVNGKDGSAVVINGKDGSIGLNGKDGKDGLTMKSAQGKPGVDGKDGETKTRIVYETKDKDGKPVTEEVATLNDGLKFGDNSGNVHNAKLNSQVNVKGAETNKDWGKFDGGKNIMTQIKGNTITVGLANDINVNSVTTNKVTVGDTTITTDGVTINNGPSMTKSGGINANNTTIKNVAPGVNSTDAVNVSQLRQVQGNINRADKHLRAGIAGANAAAGLPQAYLPGKSMVAVSAGTYRGEGAVALGMSRISDNGKVVVKITGNSDTRGNLGASLGAGYQW